MTDPLAAPNARRMAIKRLTAMHFVRDDSELKAQARMCATDDLMAFGVTPEEIEDLIKATPDRSPIRLFRVSIATEMYLRLRDGAGPSKPADIPEERIGALVENAVRNAGRLSCEKRARWSHVRDAVAVGSTKASSLCRRLGLDPHEEIGGTCEYMANLDERLTEGEYIAKLEQLQDEASREEEGL